MRLWLGKPVSLHNGPTKMDWHMPESERSPLDIFTPDPAEAMLLRLRDEALIRYVQVGRVAGPEDPLAFPALLHALPRAAENRPPAPEVAVHAVTPGSHSLPPEFDTALTQVLGGAKQADSPDAGFRDDRFRWKLAVIDSAPRSILDLGPADGIELLYLRALAPEATLTSIDYIDGVGNKIRTACAAKTVVGSISTELVGQRGRHDLVFSHHVLEHLHDPDTTLQAIADCLIPGGTLAAGLPLEGLVNAGRARRALAVGKPLHPLDINWLVPGHAWKTTPSDLAATLERAGFTDIKIHYRPDSTGVLDKRSVGELARRYRLGRGVNASTFGVVRAILKLIPARFFPRAAARALASLERRVWFGEPTLTHSVAPEVMVTARRHGP